MPIAHTILPEFDQEMANTRKLLELFPDDKPDYQPHEKSMRLGRLASHVAEIPGWAKMTLQVTEMDLQPDMKPCQVATRKELLDLFDAHVRDARELLESASDDDLRQMWTLKVAGRTVFTMPRLAVLRGMVMNHLIHHRAQLGVYYRLNGIAIPGMYGPSADEMKFWKQPQA